jgi:hypothetical protein
VKGLSPPKSGDENLREYVSPHWRRQEITGKARQVFKSFPSAMGLPVLQRKNAVEGIRADTARIAAIRGNEGVAGISHGLSVVKVFVDEVRVEHEVKLMDFTKWLERWGGSPREVSGRHKIRSILGMPVSR